MNELYPEQASLDYVLYKDEKLSDEDFAQLIDKQRLEEFLTA